MTDTLAAELLHLLTKFILWGRYVLCPILGKTYVTTIFTRQIAITVLHDSHTSNNNYSCVGSHLYVVLLCTWTSLSISSSSNLVSYQLALSPLPLSQLSSSSQFPDCSDFSSLVRCFLSVDGPSRSWTSGHNTMLSCPLSNCSLFISWKLFIPTPFRATSFITSFFN